MHPDAPSHQAAHSSSPPLEIDKRSRVSLSLSSKLIRSFGEARSWALSRGNLSRFLGDPRLLRWFAQSLGPTGTPPWSQKALLQALHPIIQRIIPSQELRCLRLSCRPGSHLLSPLRRPCYFEWISSGETLRKLAPLPLGLDFHTASEKANDGSFFEPPEWGSFFVCRRLCT